MLVCVQGAFWALMIGLVVGVVRMSLDFVYREPACEQTDHRPAFIAKWHYMYFAMFLFFLTGIIMVVLSFFGDPPTKEQVRCGFVCCVKNWCICCSYTIVLQMLQSSHCVPTVAYRQLQPSAADFVVNITTKTYICIP